MEYEDFKKILKANNFTPASFAEEVGLTYSAVTKWAAGTPPWVDKYFALYEENKEAKELKKLMKSFCEKL